MINRLLIVLSIVFLSSTLYLAWHLMTIECLQKQVKGNANGLIIHKILLEDLNFIEVAIDSNGHLEYVANWPSWTNNTQIVKYYDSGFVESKFYLDDKEYIQGNKCVFYDESGNLESMYFYVDDMKVGQAFTYFDSLIRVQQFMQYNSHGDLYYRKTYDNIGRLINEEGSWD